MSGFLKSLEKTVSNISRDVTREVDHVTKDINREVDKHWSSPVLDNFKTGNVIQLVSQSSGHSLQVVVGPAGQLVVDGMGPEGPTVYHAHWTVINEGQNSVRLHNNNNYLAIVNGALILGSFPPPAIPGPETKFRIAVTGNFIMVESMAEKGRHIGILNNGQLKSALATGRETDSHLAPRLIYSPHVQVVQQQAAAKPQKK